jgi:iron complex outermembrane receptor protein
MSMHMLRPVRLPLAAAVALGLAAGQAAAQQALEEIVVTAQKREETVQTVANVVNVFSAEDVQDLGIREPRDIAVQTPGLLTKNGPNGLVTVGFYMRGVGINDFTGTVDSSVGVYVDEVFKASPDMLNFAIFDVERVEVLKGPQGTLYGRNSTGGAVNIITARPTEELEGYVRAGYANYDTFTWEGAVSGPITDTLLGRISIAGQESGSDSGFSHNRLTGNTLGDNDSIAVRGQLLWQPSDTFDARLIYNFGEQEGEQPLLETVSALDPVALANGQMRVCQPVIQGRRAEGQCVHATGYFDPDNDRFDSDADVDPTLKIETHAVTLQMNWHLPRFTVTSITGYEDFDKLQTQDIDSTPFAAGNNETIDNEIEAFSQEIRLTSDDSWPFSWILGAFYSDSSIDWWQTIDLSAIAIPTSNGAKQDTESWAVFAHASVPIMEKFELEGGVRFTHEERDWVGGSFVGTFRGIEQGLASGIPPLSALPIPPGGTLEGFQPGSPMDFDNTLEEDNVDFRVALKYHHTDDLMFYVSVSEGFRSGGVSSAVIFSQGALEPFGVESLRAYEGGFKMNLAGGAAQLNASAYYYDFEDYQATFVRATEVSARLQNAGDVEIYGIEASLKWLVTENLFLEAGINWMENEITDTDVILPPLDGGPATTIEGNEIANAPSYTINGRARYEFPEFQGLLPYAQVDFTVVDDHYLEPNNRAVLREDGYFLLNGRIGFRQEGRGWEAAAWVKNLTNEKYLTAAQDIILALGFAERVQGLPRTYGIEVGYRF